MRWHGELVDVKGRFRGTLTKFDQSESMEVTDGTFDISDVPSQALLSGADRR